MQGQLLGSHVLNIGGSSVDFEYIWLNNKPVVRFKTPYKADGTIKTDNLKTTWLHTDHLNTPRIGTDDQQRIVWRWDSDAFGKGSVDTDPDGDGIKHSIALRFPGQYKDGESGMHYNYFRDYDPTTGRYLQADPIGILRDYSNPLFLLTSVAIPLQSSLSPTRLNHIYSYVNQTPLNMADPFGLDTICGSGAVWIRDSSRNGGGYCKPTRDQGPQCPFGDCAAFPDSMEDACVQACIAEKLPDCVPTSATQADAVESFACASAVIIACGQKTCDKCENQ